MKIETTLTYEQFKERFEQHVMPENSYKYKYRKQIYFLGTLSNEDMLFTCCIWSYNGTFSKYI